MNESFTLRAPAGWASRLDSARMQAWLVEFFRGPRPLPDDPGPGIDRLSVSVSKREVNVLAAMLDVSPSVALRRLAAHHINRYEELPVALQEATREAIVPARPSRPSAEVRPATLVSSAPLVGQQLVRQEAALPAIASQTSKIVNRFPLWRVAAVIALLVFLPIVFLYLSHLLDGGENESEATPVYELLLEGYDLDALGES